MLRGPFEFESEKIYIIQRQIFIGRECGTFSLFSFTCNLEKLSLFTKKTQN